MQKNITTIKKQNTQKYFGLYIPKGINLKIKKEASFSLERMC